MLLLKMPRWKKKGRIRKLNKFATEMRKAPTRAEAVLEYICRGMGFNVFSQHVKSGYILDIYLPQLNVAIEADGSGHYTDKGMERDEKRLARLKSEDMNFNLIRFANDEILCDSNFSSRLADDLFKLSGFSVWPEWFKAPRPRP